MNFIIEFAINTILGILTTVVKNPAKKAALQSDLIGVAQSIADTYGYTLTAPTDTPTSFAVNVAPPGTKKIV
jgi:hypothetical protein